jgi:phosphoribosylanthranilate isomerase
MSVVVKICGVRSVADARAAVDAGADLLGLNFVPESPRHLDPDAARALARELPGVPLVGVFADAERALVEQIAEHVGLAMLQLHGDETPEYCRGLRRDAIKALRARPGDDLAARAAAYDTRFVLVDAWAPGARGGTGMPLDLEATRGIPAARLFVAGGLRPDTVADVVGRTRPHGVDVASGVERSPGVKDHGKIQEFIRRAKAA